jgi:hypothetical protein
MAQFGNAARLQRLQRGYSRAGAVCPVASVDEVGSVVLPDGGRGVLAERVEEPHGIGLGGELADGGFVGPAEGGDLVVGGELAAGDLAAED